MAPPPADAARVCHPAASNFCRSSAEKAIGSLTVATTGFGGDAAAGGDALTVACWVSDQILLNLIAVRGSADVAVVSGATVSTLPSTPLPRRPAHSRLAPDRVVPVRLAVAEPAVPVPLAAVPLAAALAGLVAATLEPVRPVVPASPGKPATARLAADNRPIPAISDNERTKPSPAAGGRRGSQRSNYAHAN